MKVIIIALIIYSSTLIASANDTVDKLIEVSGAEEELKIALEKTKENFKFDIKPIAKHGTRLHTVALETNKKKNELVKALFSWASMRINLEKAYLETYSQEELEYLLVIFSTEVGKNIMKKNETFSHNFDNLIQEDLATFRKKLKIIDNEYDIAFREYMREFQTQKNN